MLNRIFIKFLTFIINVIDYSNKKKVILYLKKILKKKELNVIDIGSHKGETIDMFMKNFEIEKIFSFEPNINLFNKLKSNMKYVNKKIHLSNFGVGSVVENKYLNIMTDTSSSTFNTLNSDSKYYIKKKKILSFLSNKKELIEQKQNIKVVNLSNFILEKDISNIDVLKIDTEGYEYYILRGLINQDFKKIKLIYFEHHYDLMINKGYKFSEINDLLLKNNFKKKFRLKMKFRKSFEYIYENSILKS
jgi:FkbM family methyltransferase